MYTLTLALANSHAGGGRGGAALTDHPPPLLWLGGAALLWFGLRPLCYGSPAMVWPPRLLWLADPPTMVGAGRLVSCYGCSFYCRSASPRWGVGLGDCAEGPPSPEKPASIPGRLLWFAYTLRI